MTVYVDPLRAWGWVLYGRQVDSCHMASDQVDLAELHAMAARIGLKRRYFQPGRGGRYPHYDLVASRRVQAVAAGAIEISSRQLVEIQRERRQRLLHPSGIVLPPVDLGGASVGHTGPALRLVDVMPPELP